MDIQQSCISCDPNAMKNVQSSLPSTTTPKEVDNSTNQSADQVRKNLAYQIPKVITEVLAKATSKDKSEATITG